MASHTDYAQCPNCGSQQMLRHLETRPVEYYVLECMDCGFCLYPTITYRTLDELNEVRKETELAPIDKLPEQNFYLNEPKDEKEFFWRDLSGRGFTNTFTFEELKKWDDEDEDMGDDGELVCDWIETADVGDRWRNSANEITRIK